MLFFFFVNRSFIIRWNLKWQRLCQNCLLFRLLNTCRIFRAMNNTVWFKHLWCTTCKQHLSRIQEHYSIPYLMHYSKCKEKKKIKSIEVHIENMWKSVRKKQFPFNTSQINAHNHCLNKLNFAERFFTTTKIEWICQMLETICVLNLINWQCFVAS